MTEFTQATTESATQTPAVKAPSEMSFSEYERHRRGEVIQAEAAKPAAPAADKAPEQKESTESAPAETDSAENEQSEESGDAEGDELDAKTDDTENAKPKKKGGFQRRIDKLNARVAEERAAREAIERKLAAIEAAGKPADVTKTAPQAGKPKPEDFEAHADYVEALTDWKLEQREAKSKAESEKAKLEQTHKQTLDAHFERERAFSEKTSDYKETIEEIIDLPFSSAVQDAITRSAIGPELLYELGKNQKEAERIARLSAGEAYKAIGKLEAKIELRASEAKKPEPKKITQAPKPIEPVGRSASPVSKDPEKMTFSEYEAYRREQLRKKRA
jgi:hypothetical protein